MIDMPEALAHDAVARTWQGTIATLLHEGILHRNVGEDDVDLLVDSGVYIDIGEDPEEERDAALEASVQEARKEGLSDNGAETLGEIISKHRQILD